MITSFSTLAIELQFLVGLALLGIVADLLHRFCTGRQRVFCICAVFAFASGLAAMQISTAQGDVADVFGEVLAVSGLLLAVVAAVVEAKWRGK